MDFKPRYGVYPTMITPYKNGEIDYEAVDALVEWYDKQGCDGIFADCQSSEIMYLSLEERVKLLRAVMAKTHELAKKNPDRPRMMIVASGHVSDSFEDQVKELNAIAAEKPDAIILITNRMDIENTSDEKWIADTEELIAELPADMPLGVYECPRPYKRLLSDKMIKWCADNGRFYFAKDTCCDAAVIARRLEIVKGSNLKLFNANAQTMLQSAKDGAWGYCGVMANIHPEVYCRMLKSDLHSKEAAILQSFICLSASVEAWTYPCNAKYYLDRHVGIPMEWNARSNNVENFDAYQQSIMDQLHDATEYMNSVKL